jgi:hypothetical protein
MLDSWRARKLTEIVAGGTSGRGPSALCTYDLWDNALDLIGGASGIAVVTGFYIPSVSAPETDGPSGSVTLARALSRFGIETEIWTDFRCIEALKVCAASMDYPGSSVRDVSENMESVTPPALLIYVERLGRASDGAYYDMKGNDISAFTCPLDDFALSGASRVIGIGDGGNEVGMGVYKAALSRLMPGYAKCLCSIGADVAIPVDVSNWGAYALAAALSVKAGEWLAQTENEEIKMTEVLRKVGAVDGVKKISSGSVDGFDISKQLQIRSALRDLL